MPTIIPLASIILWGLLGACIGSFINVITYRLPRMLLEPNYTHNLAFPRSHCPNCETTLRWYHLFPVLSYLCLKGRCGHCQESIGIHYPTIELLCGVLAVYSALHFNDAMFITLAFLIYSFALLVCLLIDAKHSILPDNITLPLLWLGLLSNINGYFIPLSEAVLAATLGYVFCWLLSYGYLLLRKRDGLGLGDAKLCAAIGAWVGVLPLTMVILFAAIAALLFAAVQMIRKKMDYHHAIPFGPFLALSGWWIFLLRT